MDPQLIDDLASFSSDPLGFVLWAFPWGEPGSVLANRTGPEPWQRELLESIGNGLPIDAAIRQATTSGNGVGKSATVAWIILWAHSTFEDTKGVVTANTETQLKTKTWAELGKWFHLFIAKDLFRLTATAMFSRDPDHERTWRVDMVPWSESNIVAFQGLHNEGKRLFIIFDEASQIDDGIWEAADGCMTDANTQRIWAVFGNPNEPEGRFRECFPGGREAHRWTSREVDSRTVSFTDKTEYQAWVDLYGEDDDFVRVRVRGKFPRRGSVQFISPDVVREAALRGVPDADYDPVVLGVDVARFGDDASVIYTRKGRDGRSIAPVVLRGLDTVALAGRVNNLAIELRADAIFVDGTGVGGGVVDQLRALGTACFDIQFAGRSDADTAWLGDTGVKYANKRAEIWGSLKSWLKSGAIPDDKQLIAEITGPQYGYNKSNEILLEAKADMKKRGMPSPDIADALALTFAYPVAPKFTRNAPRPDHRVISEYDPFEIKEEAA